jgi:hypothetical protein
MNLDANAATIKEWDCHGEVFAVGQLLFFENAYGNAFP